jgi:hypothetical protein
VRTVELLLDERLEAGVRVLWCRLRDAGLPSLANHRHPTNRPHLTLLTAASLAGLPQLPLPLPAQLGAARMLGKALVLEVLATQPLRAAHARVRSALAGPGRWPPPQEWVPHVSLALNVPAHQREAALRSLADLPTAHGQFTAARSYDTATRTVVDL